MRNSVDFVDNRQQEAMSSIFVVLEYFVLQICFTLQLRSDPLVPIIEYLMVVLSAPASTTRATQSLPSGTWYVTTVGHTSTSLE